MFNNSAVYQYFRYCATKLLLLLLNYDDDVLSQCAGYIILLFEWKMSRSTKNALTRSGDYSNKVFFTGLIDADRPVPGSQPPVSKH